jgi:NitT/TauT family transport system permease protein
LLIGIGMPYKITVVMLLTFFPILLNTITGIKNVDPSLVRMSRSFGSSDLQIFRTVALPSSVPYIITGIRQAVALGLVGVTVAELFASRQGLGYLIVRSSESFRTDTVYAAVLVLAFLGIVLTNLLQRIESYFARWRTQN